MASLERRGQNYRIIFRFGSRKFHCSLKTADLREAEGCLGRLEENLRLLERGRLQLPADVDLPTFLLSDGRLAAKPQLPAGDATLAEIERQYIGVHSHGALEANTLQTVAIHLQHFRRALGDNLPVCRLQQTNLQAYLTDRCGPGGRPVAAVTLRKEIATLRAVWNWAVRAGLIAGRPFPNQGLVYPKTEEKPPFMTWEEIERQIARARLGQAQQEDLWNCLFLTVAQIREILEFIHQAALPRVFYPMLCFAAHTGARRSEILPSQVTDIDLEAASVLIREKKRGRGQRTQRRVPLSPFLATVMKGWLARHPGGLPTFYQELPLARGGLKPPEFRPITCNTANNFFRSAFRGSKWERLRGWHVFRHSFASNCAAKGVDQRLIDAWMGHQTAEMQKRYRHLFPDQQQAALGSVFGQAQ